MTEEFDEISPNELTDNIFRLIGDEWMLITAGTLGNCNTMTASWGGTGILWHKPVATCVVRPTRYTYEFLEASETFTLSFFSEEYRKALEICGKKSGRDGDKFEAAGITPVEEKPGLVSFQEARLVLECRKLYVHDLQPDHFVDPSLDKFYPNKDYHRMYIGEITRCLVKRRS
ncbi:flavin reductase family protein [Gorillibacterium timonense]|uniref:flavin reductase family protein n=1 Tax=Gorillibacterium timonense TaxID=1689269 RepID=UPI00071D9949|nr:flavin reductase family protein [Gorillibacterium timonense]